MPTLCLLLGLLLSIVGVPAFVDPNCLWEVVGYVSDSSDALFFDRVGAMSLLMLAILWCTMVLPVE